MGYLAKRGRRWQGTYRDSVGSRHSRSFDRRAEAAAWVAEQERDVRRGRHIDPRAGRQPLGEYERVWRAARVVEVSTAATDRGRLERHVLPTWRDVPLEVISPTMVQGWVRRLVADGLAPATARSCFQLLRSILEAARRDGLIPDNPARGVTLPPLPPGREVHLSREQVDAVAAQMNDDDRTLFLLLCYTGIRWGEAAGLHVARVDLLRRQLHVVETLIEVSGRQTKPYPKGGHRRTVPITDRLAHELAAFLSRNPRGRDELVFRVYRSTWGRRHLRPALEAAGAPIVRVHDLRHTYASWLVQDGLTLPEVAKVLGHASINTTQRYAHLAPGVLDRVRDSLETPGVRSLP